MKKTLLTGIIAFLFTLGSFAQNEPQTETKKHSNLTVDSILSKYKLVEMPGPLTLEQIFPVIGEY